MFYRLTMRFKRWWWYRKGYTPIYRKLIKNWKVGMEGSIGEISPFIIQGIDEENNMIWVTFK